ncbi:uncharacterized protein LOC119302343 [Triticum dicoccoides]|uniref:uncharacterized protein LOC119302343 n=1 Tax=Triticum dicoccoides TaxID=85692 RepID=UPI000E7C3C41|nr:uncharacterized protein LOC119302343 [Triticum dicoccoides]XP_037435285.1 uncharacterized protein LOC119302343 [Triticum dicoccoides]XP_044380358.1 uncharacterized protein LOC123102937 [Triticum aestivum]
MAMSLLVFVELVSNYFMASNLQRLLIHYRYEKEEKKKNLEEDFSEEQASLLVFSSHRLMYAVLAKNLRNLSWLNGPKEPTCLTAADGSFPERWLSRWAMADADLTRLLLPATISSLAKQEVRRPPLPLPCRQAGGALGKLHIRRGIY